MTIDETRQLGIEFERRLQTVEPQFEFANKIDTEDIYAFLNQFQDIYIKQMYQLLIQGQPDSIAVRRAYSILKDLLKEARLTPQGSDSNIFVNTESNIDPFWIYIDSYSGIVNSYKTQAGSTAKYTKNILANPSDNLLVLESHFNEGNIIRRPIVSIIDGEYNNFPKFKIMKDSYTTIESVIVNYIAKPASFGISMSGDIECQLGSDAFNDLVQGAVELYINHKRGLPPVQRQEEKQQKTQQEENEQ